MCYHVVCLNLVNANSPEKTGCLETGMQVIPKKKSSATCAALYFRSVQSILHITIKKNLFSMHFEDISKKSKMMTMVHPFSAISTTSKDLFFTVRKKRNIYAWNVSRTTKIMLA